MKNIRNLLFVLFSAVAAFGCTACSEKQGKEPVENIEPGRPADLLTLLYQSIEEQNRVNPRKHVYIVAHRANTLKAVQEYVPENSLKIIQMAIDAGVDMIEIDVRPTKDGELVLMHDATIDRTTNGKGTVSKMTYSEILKYDMKRSTTVSEGMKVPTLREAFELCKGKIFINLDIHGKAVPVTTLAALIKECGMIDQVMIYSSKEELVEYQNMDPNFIIHPYVSSIAAAKDYRQYPGAMLFQYGLDYDKGTNSEFAAQMRSEGFLTYTNILNQDNQLLKGNYTSLVKFIESETDFIQTDYFELVNEYLKVEGLR